MKVIAKKAKSATAYSVSLIILALIIVAYTIMMASAVSGHNDNAGSAITMQIVLSVLMVAMIVIPAIGSLMIPKDMVYVQGSNIVICGPYGKKINVPISSIDRVADKRILKSKASGTIKIYFKNTKRAYPLMYVGNMDDAIKSFNGLIQCGGVVEVATGATGDTAASATSAVTEADSFNVYESMQRKNKSF